MALPRKGSRRVHVGEVEYVWVIRKKPTYLQAAFEAPMRLAIQRCSPGLHSVLVVDLQTSRPDNWIKPHYTTVTPAVVRNIIAHALANGWRPDGSGRAFLLAYPLAKDRT